MSVDTMKESSWFTTILRPSRKSKGLDPEKTVIGILSFDVSRLMSKVANLWHSLSDRQISRLKHELRDSLGIRTLISDNHDYLTNLALAEIIDNVRGVAISVARLGKKCVDPIYHNLDHVFDNPFEIDPQWCGWDFKFKKMEKRVKKMKRFSANMSQLYEELEVLSDLECRLRRMEANNVNQAQLNEFHQKVMWQREEVSGLREMSPWVRTYDYVVRLLLRSLFTIVERVKGIFGITTQMGSSEVRGLVDGGCFVRCNTVSALTRASVYPSESSFGRSISNLGRYPSIKSKRLTSRIGKNTTFDKKFKKISSNSQETTLGNTGLALHYANLIIFIESLAMSPRFMSPDAKQDLYDKLTTNIKDSLREKLNLFSKNEAFVVFNHGVASDWSSSVKRILDWLSPLAHNMIKWYSERNFEKQRMDNNGNVLLVQTLFYADQETSEIAITELLIGLHYISRFSREIIDKSLMGSV